MKKFVDRIVEFMGRGNTKRIESIKDLENGFIDINEINENLISNLESQIEIYKDMVKSRDTHIEALNDHITHQNKAIIILKFNLESK
mgnify:FL=1|tara:strand:- start:611 stop:871 length:261 start_codon:yes stop_codon:yes gene_type:complete